MRTRQEIELELCADVEIAMGRVKKARAEFTERFSEVPGALPSEVGTLLPEQADEAERLANFDLLKAVTRLNQFILHGVIPPDIQR